MADPNSSIFNKKAAEQLRSPDDLDKYVKVTNPSVWVVLAACIILLAGLLAWGVFGAVSTNVTTVGARSGESVICMVDGGQASQVNVGDQATVNGVPLTVESISELPLSRQEASALLESDYLASTLIASDWSYVVTLSGSDAANLNENVPLSVSITIESVAPISLIFGG